MLRRPATAEGSPFFLFGGEAILVEALDGPVGGGLKIGRAGQPRTVDIGEEKQVVHHFGVVEGFGLDPVDDCQIHFLLGQQDERDGNRGQIDQGTDGFARGHITLS